MQHPHAAGRPGNGTLVLIWLVALLLMVGDADASPAPGSGELEVRGRDGWVAVPALETAIDLDVTGPLVRAVVRQDFTNPAPTPVSARYVFPLPSGAAVAAMELRVGERRIVSVVKEKAAARAVYEKARQEGRTAALVSAVRPDLFVTEVANIGAGETVTVRLEYLDQADYEDGWFSLAVPLTFTPRYFPPGGAEADSATAADPGDDPDAVLRKAAFAAPGDPLFPRARIEVRLNPGLDLADVQCPSHEAHVERDGTTWLVGPGESPVPADRDFLLRWRPVRDALARPLLLREDTPEGAYALLMVVPGDPDPLTPRPATDTVFVLDVSGSMGGPSLDQARVALQAAISALRPDDRFTVLAFDDRTETWADGLRPADAGQRRSARLWVRRREAGGGTEMHPALLRARLLCGDAAAEGRARQIILLTDAAVGNEDQLLRETVAALAGVRLHVVGIGAAPNRHLVRRLAGEGGGRCLFVAGHGDDPVRLSTFLARLGRPQWTDPRLAWKGDPEVEGYPARLPAPVPGELVLWSGRFAAGTDLEGFLRAGGGDAAWMEPLAATPAPQGAGLATRWARLRVDDLLAAHDAGGDREALRADIVATGLEHGLVTRFTSRVAVETVATVDGAAPTADVPAGLPHGSQLIGGLPAGGTLDRLWRVLAIVLLLTGAAALKAGRRGWVR